jgi:hypothetical protein
VGSLLWAVAFAGLSTHVVRATVNGGVGNTWAVCQAKGDVAPGTLGASGASNNKVTIESLLHTTVSGVDVRTQLVLVRGLVMVKGGQQREVAKQLVQLLSCCL